MNYHLYHDETKVDGYWHGILLVPEHRKFEMVALLDKVRKNVFYKSEIGIKKVKKGVGKVYGCAQGFLNVGLYALVSNLKGQKYRLDIRGSDKGLATYEMEVEDIIGAKFIVYRERDNVTNIDLYPDHCSIVETTKRFAIKGGLHYLGSDEQPIRITRMFFDGHQHHKRHIDKQRLVERMKDLRGYAAIDNHELLIDDRHSNHEKAGAMDYVDCQLIQLTDLLVGAFRTSYGYTENPIQRRLCKNIKTQLVDKVKMGYARMQNSRWHQSIYVGQCYHTDSIGWQFEKIQYKMEAVAEQGILF